MSKSQDTADPPKTLTVAEAGAQYFGLCRASSCAAVKRGDIPVIKVGRFRRVAISGPDAYLRLARRR